MTKECWLVLIKLVVLAMALCCSVPATKIIGLLLGFDAGTMAYEFIQWLKKDK